MRRTRKAEIAILIFTTVILLTMANLYYNWQTSSRPEGILHLSVDDVIDVFVDLTENQDHYDSVFDNEMLAMFLQYHNKYGAKFSLYCFYESGDFNLSMVPSKYHDELVVNSDWLRFGYHAKSSNTELTAISADEIEQEYCLTVSELERITGSVTHTLRLSMFHGNKDAMERLKELGVKVLLTADDGRLSYYLDEEISKYISDHDSIEDSLFTFVSTDLRLDRLSKFAVYPRLLTIAFDTRQNKIITVFTHEWLINEKTYKKIRDVCRFAQNYQYRFETELL